MGIRFSYFQRLKLRILRHSTSDTHSPTTRIIRQRGVDRDHSTNVRQRHSTFDKVLPTTLRQRQEEFDRSIPTREHQSRIISRGLGCQNFDGLKCKISLQPGYAISMPIIIDYQLCLACILHKTKSYKLVSY